MLKYFNLFHLLLFILLEFMCITFHLPLSIIQPFLSTMLYHFNDILEGKSPTFIRESHTTTKIKLQWESKSPSEVVNCSSAGDNLIWFFKNLFN